MARYEEQERTLAGRGSYSKTDRDATFMRMKEDSLTNQTKPGYNVQAGTEGQFILDVTCHQRPGDTACMVPHLEHAEGTMGHLPSEVVADAGYGSEQNYAWLEERGCDAYVKHNEFFRECRNSRWREDPMRPANWAYDGEADAYACPEGHTLSFRREEAARTDLGCESATRVYVGEGCPACPLRGRCFRSKDPEAVRVLRVNPTLDAFKRRASEMLHTERGSMLRRRRSVDVETIFAQLGLQAVPPARAREGRPRDAHGRDGPQHPQDGLRACGVGLVPPLAHKRWPAATADSVIAGHLFRGF